MSQRESYGNIAASQVPFASPPADIRGIAQRMLDSQTNQQRMEVPAAYLCDRSYYDADQMAFLFHHFVSTLTAMKSREQFQIASFGNDRTMTADEQAFRAMDKSSSYPTCRRSTRTSSELFGNPSRIADLLTSPTHRNGPSDTLERPIQLQPHSDTLFNPNEPCAGPAQQQLRSGQPKIPMTNPTFESTEDVKSFLKEYLKKDFKNYNVRCPMQQPPLASDWNMDNTGNGIPRQYGEYPSFQLSEPIVRSVMCPSDPPLASYPSHTSTPPLAKVQNGDRPCLLSNNEQWEQPKKFIALEIEDAKKKSLECLGEISFPKEY
jgi:hypothetical protein